MSATNDYLGHVTITPPLNQAEYDHLRAVSRGEVHLVGPDELEPWCPWEPCAHGCCLRWSGSDSHGTGAEGLQLLIDRFLSPGDPGGSVDSPDAPELAGFTFDHDTNGVIACEDGERGLYLLRVNQGRVRVEMLLAVTRRPGSRGSTRRRGCRGCRPSSVPMNGTDGTTSRPSPPCGWRRVTREDDERPRRARRAFVGSERTWTCQRSWTS